MKILAPLFALLCGGALFGQDVNLKEIVGPNNAFNDPVFSVSLTYPPGWEVTAGMRWGKNNAENTFRFRPLWPSEALPSLYYQPFSPDSPRPTNLEAYFLESARKKEMSRGDGYRNDPDSYVFRTIGGKPAFSYQATFKSGSRKMAEYFVRIVGQKAYVMFFTIGSAEDIAAIRADIDRMAETVHVP